MLHTCNISVLPKYIYNSKKEKETMNFRGYERYMGGAGESKGKGVIVQLYFN